MSGKSMRFANPKPLNLETRILFEVIPGGITVGEVDAAFRKCWGRSSSSGDLDGPFFFKVNGVTTEGFDFDLSLYFNANAPADSDPDLMVCQTGPPNGPFEFLIERQSHGYVRRIKLADGIELEDKTAEKAFGLLPEIIAGAFWIKRGPFRLKKPESPSILPPS